MSGRCDAVGRMEFSGEVNWVQIDPSFDASGPSSGQALEKDDHDHLISPEERFRVAMMRQ